jgi:predicted ATPase
LKRNDKPQSRIGSLQRLPVLLRDAMADRLATLPATAVRLVEAAAVLGTPAPAGLLAEVGDVPGTR